MTQTASLEGRELGEWLAAARERVQSDPRTFAAAERGSGGEIALPHDAPHVGEEEVLHRPALMRAVRRRLDLSQRELAIELRVAPSTVARAEMADGGMQLDLLIRSLAMAGLRLAVIDVETGEELPLEDTDTVHDRAGRRYPPHLDIHPHFIPALRARDPLPGRTVGYHRRPMRDYLHASGIRPRPHRHLTRPEVWWAMLGTTMQDAHLDFTVWAGRLAYDMCRSGLGRHAFRVQRPRPRHGWTDEVRPGDPPPSWLRWRLRLDGPPPRQQPLTRPHEWRQRPPRPQDLGLGARSLAGRPGTGGVLMTPPYAA